MIRRIVLASAPRRAGLPGRQGAARRRSATSRSGTCDRSVALSPVAQDVGHGPLSHRARQVGSPHRSELEPAPDPHRTEGLEGFLDVDVRRRRHRHRRRPEGRAVVAQSSSCVGQRLEDRELQRRIDARRYPDDRRAAAPTFEGERQTVATESRATSRSAASRAGTRTRSSSPPSTTARSASQGESSFDIRDFGMEPPRILMLQVHPDVKVRIEVVAEKED